MIEPRFPKSVKQESKPHKFCPGCGYGLILRSLSHVVDDLALQGKSVFMTDIGCNLLAWDFFDIPTCQTHHGRTVATVSGFKMAEPSKNVICLIGDGGGYAIGLQNLIHACLRDTPVTIILVNNTNYGMTGGQAAPTTTEGQVTDSTPSGKKENVQGTTFKGPEMLRSVANPKAYIARTSSGQPEEIKKFLTKAFACQKEGHFSFIEVLSACPQNWKTDAQETIERLKSLETTFPRGEISENSKNI